ncbi:MAG: nusB [Acidimicrobiales bacterium]|nr:nusB [Acidimicrobiales bacterium]
MAPLSDAPAGGPNPAELNLNDGDVVESMEVLPADAAGPDEDAVLAEVDADELEAVAPRVSGFDGVGTRREARERALALLYEAEQKGLPALAEVIDALPLPPEPFAAELVVGVSDHLGELDEIIGRFSVGWTVIRMPAIDRALLRMGTYELAHTDVPVGVCISEAVELAKRYSTDDSHVFVNGLLSRLAAELRGGAA